MFPDEPILEYWAPLVGVLAPLRMCSTCLEPMSCRIRSQFHVRSHWSYKSATLVSRCIFVLILWTHHLWNQGSFIAFTSVPSPNCQDTSFSKKNFSSCTAHQSLFAPGLFFATQKPHLGWYLSVLLPRFCHPTIQLHPNQLRSFKADHSLYEKS